MTEEARFYAWCLVALVALATWEVINLVLS